MTLKQLKDSPAPTSMRRHSRRSIRLILASLPVILAASYLLLPGWWQWSESITNGSPETQILVHPSTANPTLVRELRTVRSGTQGAPLILTYHDVLPHPELYSITPQMFSSQMQLLHDAGYRTLTAKQIVAWLRGTPVPPHSVALTFDDGATGVWQYAAPIMARYGFYGIAFVITGDVGTHQPYYMTWAQIASLEASGHWNIESHTNKGHIYIVTNPRGGYGPFLTSLRYLTSQHRSETIGEYTQRVKKDLAESKHILILHGIPTPELFAYPFSAYVGNSRITHILHEIVSTDFAGAMLDESGGSPVTSVADIIAHEFHRVDVTNKDTLAMWTANIIAATPLSPMQVAPFSYRKSWVSANESPVEINLHNGYFSIDPHPGTWLGYLFAQTRTSLWRRYNVHAVLGGLGSNKDGTTTGLRVLTNDPQQIQVTVAAGYYQIRQGLGFSARLLREGALPPFTKYAVVIEVTPKVVRISISHRSIKVIKLHKRGGQLPAGGIELTGQRRYETSSLPRISELKISE